jgi:hypothetical protein
MLVLPVNTLAAALDLRPEVITTAIRDGELLLSAAQANAKAQPQPQYQSVIDAIAAYGRGGNINHRGGNAFRRLPRVPSER